MSVSRADDITLSDGTVLKNAKVVQRDDSAKTVTISFSGGIAQVRSEVLPTTTPPTQSPVVTTAPNPSTPVPDSRTPSSPSTPIPKDWTVNGREFHNVTVGQVEADRVHITYDGGLGTVMLADMPPDLRKAFNYDPVAAQQVEAQREADQQQYAALDAARANQQAQQAKRDALAQHPYYMQGFVLQKVPEGLLVQCNQGELVTDGKPFVGTDGRVHVIPNPRLAGTERLYGIFLLKNAPNEASLVDNDRISQICYPCGNYSYTSVTGAGDTVRAYTAALP